MNDLIILTIDYEHNFIFLLYLLIYICKGQVNLLLLDVPMFPKFNLSVSYYSALKKPMHRDFE